MPDCNKCVLVFDFKPIVCGFMPLGYLKGLMVRHDRRNSPKAGRQAKLGIILQKSVCKAGVPSICAYRWNSKQCHKRDF